MKTSPTIYSFRKCIAKMTFIHYTYIYFVYGLSGGHENAYGILVIFLLHRIFARDKGHKSVRAHKSQCIVDGGVCVPLRFIELIGTFSGRNENSVFRVYINCLVILMIIYVDGCY